MNHQKARERIDLEEPRPSAHGDVPRPVVALLVEDLDGGTIRALQRAETTGPGRTHAVHVIGRNQDPADILARWAALEMEVPLRTLRHDGSLASTLAGYAVTLAGDADVTVIIPDPWSLGFLDRFRHRRTGVRLARALAPYPDARVILVRDHPGTGHRSSEGDGDGQLGVPPRQDHRAVVLVDRPGQAVLRAIQYALTLGAEEVVAVHAAVDPDLQEELIDRWMDLRIPVPLELVECWDRDVARSLERRVSELVAGRAEVTAILPRRDHATLRQRLLRDRTSRRIARVLGRHEHVNVAVVLH